MNSERHLKFVSYLYCFGALLVVIGHSTPTSFSDMPEVINTFRDFIYAFHMPLFFFIAGFLFKYASELRTKKYCAFIKDKCIKFLTPYIVLTFVGIIPKILLSNFVNEDVEFSVDYLIKTIFSPRDNVWGHFWFLPTLLIIYFFSYLILSASKNKVAFSILLVFSLFIAVFPIDIYWFAINDICDQLIYFCLGMLFENIILNRTKDFLQLGFAIFNVFFAIFIFIFVRCYNLYVFDGLLNLSNIIIGVLMIYSILFVSVALENKRNRILDYFDGKTFSIYIISWPCQAVTEIVVNRILHMHWYIVMPAMFIAGLGVPLLLNEVYSRIKWHPEFVNLIFGFSLKEG